MTAPIRWGIIGTGDIARQFAEDLPRAENAALHAVASRREETARRFADTHGIPNIRVGYDTLVADPEVDAIYIGTPHTMHLENALMCLGGNKPVLCEKPMGINEDQARTMVDEAASRKVFLMEAMWTFFFPAIQKLRELIRAGAIGEVRLVSASFCFDVPFDPGSRLFNPEFAGGALLDVGIYPIALAQWVYEDEPEAVEGLARIGESGVDEINSFSLRFPDGGLATLSSGVPVYQPEDAVVAGSEGYIRIEPPFYQPDAITLVRGDAEERFAFDRRGYGYHLEAAHAGACIRDGLTESPVASHAESLRLARTMDRIRERWGLRYPADNH